MSNLEKDPAEVLLAEPRIETPPRASVSNPAVEVLEPREVPLGGPRALMVRRTLPQRARSLVGAWCFVDSYGPTPAPRARVMDTPPHPHTGLQTVSWLYQGEIEHRDSAGHHALVEPGQVNLMTAGAGIQHSEVSTDDARTLHGVQLWIALPDASRGVAPFFESFAPEPFAHGDATLRVFVGELLGHGSTVTGFTRLLGAQLDLPAGGAVSIPADPSFEYGLVVDAGAPTLQGVAIPAAHLGVVPDGRRRARHRGRRRAAARAAHRRRAARRADRHVVELRRPQPRRDRGVPRAVDARGDRRRRPATGASARVDGYDGSRAAGARAAERAAQASGVAAVGAAVRRPRASPAPPPRPWRRRRARCDPSG